MQNQTQLRFVDGRICEFTLYIIQMWGCGYIHTDCIECGRPSPIENFNDVCVCV